MPKRQGRGGGRVGRSKVQGRVRSGEAPDISQVRAGWVPRVENVVDVDTEDTDPDRLRDRITRGRSVNEARATNVILEQQLGDGVGVRGTVTKVQDRAYLSVLTQLPARSELVVGIERDRCPRCEVTWAEHPPAASCVSKGMGFVRAQDLQPFLHTKEGPIQEDGRNRSLLHPDRPIEVDFIVGLRDLGAGKGREVATTGWLPLDAPDDVVMEAAERARRDITHAVGQVGQVRVLENGQVIEAAPCTPAQMPDERLRIMAGWDSPAWIASSRANMNDARQRGHVDAPPVVDEFVGGERRLLAGAGLWWVGLEMCDVIFAAAPNIPAETMVSDLTWPDEQGTPGLVILERSWRGVDAANPDNMVTVDAFLWGLTLLPPDAHHPGPDRYPCVSVSSYRLLRFENGLSPGELSLATAMGAFDQGKRHLESHVTNGGKYASTFNLTGSAWVPLGRSDWPLDEPLGAPLDLHLPDTPGGRRYAESSVEDRRMLAALWALLQTKTLAQVHDGHVDRQTRRRSERAGLTVPSTVKVITLRRPEAPKGDDHDVEHRTVNWSHRWIVNAHPRLQPYGPGRRQRKLIMVGPYVKGPEDKELVVKTTVKAVVR